MERIKTVVRSGSLEDKDYVCFYHYCFPKAQYRVWHRVDTQGRKGGRERGWRREMKRGKPHIRLGNGS